MSDSTPAFHPLDYVSMLRRRMWWLFVPLALALAIGAALVTWLPREYRATATLGVSIPTISSALMREGEAQRVTPEERTRTLSQVLTSPAVLERVAREEGLDRELTLAGAVQQLRAQVTVTTPPPDPSLPPGTVEQFFVSYQDDTPDRTQRVANRLADVFVDEASRKREVRAEETSSFISQQLQGSQARLTELESQLRVAKESHMGALPEQTQANVAMTTGLQQQLETTTNAMRGEQDRLSMVERQLDAMRTGAATDVAAPGVPPPPASAALRLVQLERDLATARAAYTDKHPEVVRLKQDLEAARADAAAEASRPEAERTASLQVDPGYRALLGDREQGRLRITELQRQATQIQAQIGMYRARVESAPRVEQQFTTLQREYDLERQQYGDLTSRLRTAQMSETLERTRGGEQFTVLARANVPDAPVTPNPQRLMLIALLAGACLGGALAIGREYLDRSIHDARAIEDLDVPVLGEIPSLTPVA